jgi:Tat protein secretion system quality control protein TatD with DNase activity
MSPEPLRGRKSEPAFVAFTAARIAELREEPPEVFGAAAFATARRLLDRERT